MKVPVGNKLYTTRVNVKRPRIFVRKNGVTEYFELTPDKKLTTSGNKFYIIINNIRHYIKEIFVIAGEYLLFINTFKKMDGWSNWYGSKTPIQNYGFINGVSIKIKCTLESRWLQFVYQEIKITNAKNTSKTVTKLQKWGISGSYLEGPLNATINLTQEDLNMLGGAGTEILIDYRTYISTIFFVGSVTTEIRISTF